MKSGKTKDFRSRREFPIITKLRIWRELRRSRLGALSISERQTMVAGQVRHSGMLWVEPGVVDGVPEPFRDEIRRRISEAHTDT